MKNFRIYLSALFIFLIVVSQKSLMAKDGIDMKNLQDSSQQNLNEIIKKEKIRILITDSGLGGLSVAADIEKKLNLFKPFKEAEIIFFNSLPAHSKGYNSMQDSKQKAKVFNSALNSMVENYDPDIILIACNTLSVVYPETEFSKTTKIPVIGIVELGVNLISDNLQNNPGSNVFILGTPTTVSSDSHKKKLIAKGFPEDVIYSQPCKNLESEIQENTESKAVHELLDKYSDEMKSKIKFPAAKTFIGLCCTHYGYAFNLIDSVLKSKLGNNVELLNPNSKMGDLLITDANRYRFDEISTTVKVVSQVDISEQENKSLGKLLGKESIKTEKALKNYIHKEKLFEYKKFIE